jgi:hypothetical protein
VRLAAMASSPPASAAVIGTEGERIARVGRDAVGDVVTAVGGAC